ncbi:MAG: ATP-dependent helicase [Ignavibacteria bacterium]|nr:ATP-dependent helicase [Ignavibacteria bacterium]
MKRLVLKKTTLSTFPRNYKIAYETELNPAQYEAVMHNVGPALILAGAGTGKTRTLIYRVARLVEDGADPTSVLLLTFTRKAAREMLHRAGGLLDGRCNSVAGGTFHSFAFSMMKRFRTRVSVLDQSDAEDVMNMVRGRFDVSKIGKRFPQKGTLLDMSSTSINTMTPLSDVVANKFPQFLNESDLISQIIHSYHSYKQHINVVDYDDLLLHLLSMTRENEISAALMSQYRFIMVDEYQDTNVLQHEIIKGLSGSEGNVVAVGDDAQSIYSFRGADIRNIHSFPDSFASCKIIRLEHNYRSTQPILDVCNKIIADAPAMFNKELFSNRKDGEQPILVACSNERQQSVFVVQQILELHENGLPLSQISVLMRAGFLSFDLEIELSKANIPYRKFGGLRFTEAAHIKDVLALLRITVNAKETISWYRTLMLQKGVGRKVATNIVDQIAEMTDPLTESFHGISEKVAITIEGLRSAIRNASKMSDPRERIVFLNDLYKPIMERTYADHQKRSKDIETVMAICSRYSSVEMFLSDIALEPPNQTLDDIESDDGEDEFVTVSTIHSAKGLEWNTVFVIWVNEGRIPSARSAESEALLEEERRLLYVACTRAKERLIMIYPTVLIEGEYSDVLGRPCRFLDVVDEEHAPKYFLAEESQT